MGEHQIRVLTNAGPTATPPSPHEPERLVTASARALELAIAAAEAASEKLAEDIVALDVSDTLVITDVFLLCSASNDRQVKAIVDGIEARLDEMDIDPVRREGEREGRWVLLDYLDLVVHVQHSDDRSYYGL